VKKINKIIFSAGIIIILAVIFTVGNKTDFNSQNSKTQTLKSKNTASTSLIIEPDDGITPIISLINNAKKSIDLVMYELEDKQIEQALASAEKRGVSVRVILNKGYYGEQETVNESAFLYFQTNDVSVRWSPSYFALTHQKTIVIDGNDALIMTFNFTPQYYASDRDFGINDEDQNDVSAIEKTFDADWQNNKISTLNGDDLIWSPNSKTSLLSLINNAKSSVEIYNEEMSDSDVISALETAAKRGVNVEVDMTYSNNWKSAFQKLSSSGVHVRTFSSDASIYIHAKMILVDDKEAFVGSENFSTGSMDDNRELGIIINEQGIINSLNKIFNDDWQLATPFTI
jgi:phosphatidylserine/phosphatidylglycerophosphate/cardiolipin synthase-like enzyme